MKGIKHFDMTGKLSPIYVDPYEILEINDKVAYILALTENMFGVHYVFHISLLQTHVVDESNNVISDHLDNQDLAYVEAPEWTLGYEVRHLKSQEIPSIHALWKKKLSTIFIGGMISIFTFLSTKMNFL